MGGEGRGKKNVISTKKDFFKFFVTPQNFHVPFFKPHPKSKSAFQTVDKNKPVQNNLYHFKRNLTKIKIELQQIQERSGKQTSTVGISFCFGHFRFLEKSTALLFLFILHLAQKFK